MSPVHFRVTATWSCVPPVKGTEKQSDGSGQSEGFPGAQRVRGPWVNPHLGRSCPQQTKHHRRKVCESCAHMAQALNGAPGQTPNADAQK